jgi:DNA-binding CsgD family transcriptional regulator
VLVGRDAERARIDRLLAAAAGGRSDALVLRGEPGIGKSALLDDAAARADGFAVVRALGVESEAELDFSGLLDVCRPLLAHLDELPAHQAEALRGALGLAPTPHGDRFTIGAATLDLLAAAGEERPLLVLVDDAHWLDRASADALLFAARRLDADAVALLFAVRDPDVRALDAPGLESLPLAGLGVEAAGLLLRGAAPAIDPAVADRLVAATGGNPLALLELPHVLTPGQLAGREALGEPLPAAAGVERAYARRLADLPDETRRALLVAAVATSSERDAVASALAAAGLEPAALEPAEDAALVRLDDGHVRFVHPLVRAAVHQAAAPSERRAAHRAAAEAHGGERRAWHLAAAALGPDETVAAALEEAGRQAIERTGFAAGAAALERAAQLTPDGGLRDRRLFEAARAAWQAGSAERARELLAGPLAEGGEPTAHAQAVHLRSHIELLSGAPATAASALLEAAAHVDGQPALGLLVEASEVALYRGDVGAGLAAAKRARALAPEDESAGDVLVEIALGEALLFAGRLAEGAPRLERAFALVERTDELRRDPRVLAHAAIALGWLDRPLEGRETAARAVAIARERGAVGLLPYALEGQAWHESRLGLWPGGYALALEALALARETGQENMVAHGLEHLAVIDSGRGHEEECRRSGGEAVERAERAGLHPLRLRAECALGRLDLSLGRLDAAIERLERARADVAGLGIHDCGAAPWPDLIEALVRAGERDRAAEVLAELAATRLEATPIWGRAAAFGGGALLAADDAFDDAFANAVSLHEWIGDRLAAARARLCWGERLRRAGRRADAREQLRASLAAFEELGARAWADRAGAELRATGETIRRRVAWDDRELTPQELQIAAHVAEGRTNREVGAALFLSHKTVESHLARVYRKLGIHSRAELIRLFAGGPIIER